MATINLPDFNPASGSMEPLSVYPGQTTLVTHFGSDIPNVNSLAHDQWIIGDIDGNLIASNSSPNGWAVQGFIFYVTGYSSAKVTVPDSCPAGNYFVISYLPYVDSAATAGTYPGAPQVHILFVPKPMVCNQTITGNLHTVSNSYAWSRDNEYQGCYFSGTAGQVVKVSCTINGATPGANIVGVFIYYNHEVEVDVKDNFGFGQFVGYTSVGPLASIANTAYADTKIRYRGGVPGMPSSTVRTGTYTGPFDFILPQTGIFSMKLQVNVGISQRGAPYTITINCTPPGTPPVVPTDGKGNGPPKNQIYYTAPLCCGSTWTPGRRNN
jgi:hypothetical protein